MFNLKKIKFTRKALIWMSVAIGAILIAGIAYAAVTFSDEQIKGTGTITVNPTTPPPTPTVGNFSISPSTVDFSGSVTVGNSYQSVKQVTVTNTSTVGNDGETGNITSLSVSASPLPSGWTLTGSWNEIPLTPGSDTLLYLTLTSPTLTSEDDVMLEEITITISAN